MRTQHEQLDVPGEIMTMVRSIHPTLSQSISLALLIHPLFLGASDAACDANTDVRSSKTQRCLVNQLYLEANLNLGRPKSLGLLCVESDAR